MKKVVCGIAVMFAFTICQASAQDHARGEIAVGYNFVHSNAPPGGCGCFNWNGGSVSGAVRLGSRWNAVGEFAGVHAGAIGTSSVSPTMTSYIFGLRYKMTHETSRVLPFAQVLAGATHASSGYFPSGTGSSTSATGFAMSAGGGMDFVVTRHLVLRPVTAEYLLTLFPNGTNGRQNNFRMTSGLVLRF